MSILEKFPDLVEVQAKAEETLCTPTRDLKGDYKNVFEAVLRADDDVLELGLGRLGKALKTFAQKADLHHPTIQLLNDGAFLEGSQFYNQVVETIVLSQCAKEKSLKVMPSEIANWLNETYQRMVKILLKPPVSIIAAEEARKEARDVAKPHEIDLSSHYSNAGIWEAIWPSCKPYVRLGEGFKGRIEYHKKVIQRLSDLKASTMADSLRKQNEALMAASQDHYCGFVRLLMADAALNLAKIMGFLWSDDLGRVVVNRNQISIPVSDDKQFLYLPRTYPLPKYPAALSEKTKEIIAKLEAHPDSAGKPLFDMYWAVVPGIGVKGSRPSFFDGHARRTFDSSSEMYSELDRILIENGDIVPILLGENVIEHKCYFISYMV